MDYYGLRILVFELGCLYVFPSLRKVRSHGTVTIARELRSPGCDTDIVRLNHHIKKLS